MIYSICDFYVEYEPRYSRLRDRSKKYLAKDQSVLADFRIEVTEDEISEHIKKYVMDNDLAEYVLMGAKFYEEILLRGAFILHSSAVSVDSFGFVFTGPCGAGKSTHASLWRKYFGDKVISINDDKPVLKIEDDTVFVCGTPFSGKHDINANVKVPLCGICVMNQSKDNSIVRLKSSEAVPILLEQTLRPKDSRKMSNLFAMMDETLLRIPVYRLSCNISFDAVELAYSTMKGER